MSQPKKVNYQPTTMESLHVSGVKAAKSLVKSSSSPVKSKASTECLSTVTDYAAIFNLHEEADVIHISGDTKRKMLNAEREHHINATLIDNGEIRSVSNIASDMTYAKTPIVYLSALLKYAPININKVVKLFVMWK